MARVRDDDFFPEARNPEGTRAINGRCVLRIQDGHCVVTVSGVILAHYEVGDSMAEAFAMVSLVDQGLADQNDVARAFHCSARSVRRHQRRYEEGGLAALGRKSGYPEGRPRLPSSRSALVQRLKAEGHNHCEIARRLGVTEVAVRKLLRRLGWKETSVPEPELPLNASPGSNPNLSAFSALASPSSSKPSDIAASASPVPFSLDHDPADRSGDRLLACLGLLEDARPLFASGKSVPRAGVLLALLPLVQGGVFECAQRTYGSVGPAFYGLRTSLVTLLFMALWRMKRPEALKEHSPQELGRVLGLDRAPEVKTLRRKLAQLAATGRAAQFGLSLAEHRVGSHDAALGFLYVDGHVRVYHGHHKLPKAYVARAHRSMPATSDYWVNDMRGDPLFVVTAQANAGLVTMLPSILEQVGSLVGKRLLTFVFDRGGYSPKLFLKILAAGYHIITYRKGRHRPIPQSRFGPCQTRQEGKVFAYSLADQEIRLLKGKLRLRQVTRRMDNGHQTTILTSRRDLPAAQVAYRMFERWRQENFFKYLREEYALDALADYEVLPDDLDRQVPNPARTLIGAKLCQAQAELDRLQAEYGLQALTNPEHLRSSIRGFKIAHGKLGKRISAALDRVLALQARKRKIPRRVPVRMATSEPVVKLAPERKHLTNLLKMVAYQAESELFRMLAPHYSRADDEGRTLIQSALMSAADLQVTEDELRVNLLPFSSAHRSRALAGLCQELNKTRTLFPGSILRLRFAVKLAD